MPFRGYLAFLHGFKQCALCLGRGAVDFVGQDDVDKDRAREEAEITALTIENRKADDIGREHVAGELDA